MAKGFTKLAGLAAIVATGTVALVELPVAARASAASGPGLVREASLPETAPAPALRGGRSPARPASCAEQAWPYITPACATRDDGRPLRHVRIVTASDAVSPTVKATVEVASAAGAVAAAPAKPARKPARATATRAAAAAR